jgi:hypothetical protein
MAEEYRCVSKENSFRRRHEEFDLLFPSFTRHGGQRYFHFVALPMMIWLFVLVVDTSCFQIKYDRTYL